MFGRINIVIGHHRSFTILNNVKLSIQYSAFIKLYQRGLLQFHFIASRGI